MKIQDFTFSGELRKQTELMDFVQEVRQTLNTAVTGVLAKSELTGQTGDIAATTLLTPTTAWLFRVSVYMICTTAGGGTLSCTVRWTDEAGAKSSSPAASVDLSSTSNGSTGDVFIRANVAAITFETAIAGKTGSPQYSLYVIIEQLG